MATAQLCATVATLVFMLGATPAVPISFEHTSRALLLKGLVRASSTSSGEGDNSSETFVSTRVVRNAKDALETSVATSIANIEGGGEVEAEAEASAKAVATAYIKIASNGRTISIVEGAGEACGEFFASAGSTATVIAEAIVDAFAQSENEFIIGEADAVSEAVKQATLTVEGTIQGKACSQGGVAEAVENLIAEQELEVIASAFVRAFSSVAGEDADAGLKSGASTDVKNDGSLSSDGFSSVNGKGKASTGATADVFICDNKAKQCCEKVKSSGGNICDCGSMCIGRFVPNKGEMIVSDNGSKTTCKCE